LGREVEAGTQGVLDHYGATDRAEFFAVATEAFFERPAELQHERPALYEALRDYYRQDPAQPAGAA
jgi:Mlc titration factor MtfA (ptsG expression regulator)